MLIVQVSGASCLPVLRAAQHGEVKGDDEEQAQQETDRPVEKHVTVQYQAVSHWVRHFRDSGQWEFLLAECNTVKWREFFLGGMKGAVSLSQFGGCCKCFCVLRREQPREAETALDE